MTPRLTTRHHADQPLDGKDGDAGDQRARRSLAADLTRQGAGLAQHCVLVPVMHERPSTPRHEYVHEPRSPALGTRSAPNVSSTPRERRPGRALKLGCGVGRATAASGGDPASGRASTSGEQGRRRDDDRHRPRDGEGAASSGLSRTRFLPAKRHDWLSRGRHASTSLGVSRAASPHPNAPPRPISARAPRTRLRPRTGPRPRAIGRVEQCARPGRAAGRPHGRPSPNSVTRIPRREPRSRPSGPRADFAALRARLEIDLTPVRCRRQQRTPALLAQAGAGIRALCDVGHTAPYGKPGGAGLLPWSGSTPASPRVARGAALRGQAVSRLPILDAPTC